MKYGPCLYMMFWKEVTLGEQLNVTSKLKVMVRGKTITFY